MAKRKKRKTIDIDGFRAGAKAHEAASAALHKHGLDFEFVAIKLKRLARATKVKTFNNGGEVIYSKKLADNSTRLATLDMVNKIHGSYAPKKIDETKNRPPLTIKIVEPRGREIKVHPPERRD